MGICLDTEQSNEEEIETAGSRTQNGSAWLGRVTPPAAGFPMQNSTHVKFEPPTVPVIFILGGPGSGKVTHCDNLTQERRGVVHINMTDLLQQYAIGNGTLDTNHTDMQDFGILSSKTVTEVLMLEMKMAPTAKTYLVSGYPRSMRDVAEYSDKIQTISGVVLVSWRQRVLERQIEYGARLGHVVLSLARMELKNFYKNVMPVADYFDQSNMLIAVNGERNPEEVYKDFRAAILQILGSVEDESANGVGAGGIPGEIVGIEPAPTPEPTEPNSIFPDAVPIGLNHQGPEEVKVEPQRIISSPQSNLIRVRGARSTPAIVWVVGGPGSNKAVLCQRAVAQTVGWKHFSLGQRLRALADSGGGPASEAAAIRTALSAGELVGIELAGKLVRAALNGAAEEGVGLVLDGYPRDLDQVDKFQREFYISPRMILVDCSKLQLGRGRRDDSVSAFRRRLEVFREHSLPMLKSLDQDHRLIIVDGDTDSPEVQAEFTRVLLEEMTRATTLASLPNYQPPAGSAGNDGSTIQHFAHAVARMGGGFAKSLPNGNLPNGNLPNGGLPNGNLPNGYINRGVSNKIKPMLDNPNLSTITQISQDDVRALYARSTGDVINSHYM